MGLLTDLFEIHAINNLRTPDGSWEDMDGCVVCNKVSSAYIEIKSKWIPLPRMVICKGCLGECIHMIDQKILSKCEEQNNGKS